MTPYFDDGQVQLYHGDAREVLRYLRDAGTRVDLVVTDPPYGLSEEGQTARGPAGDRNRDFFDADRSPEAAAALIGSVAEILDQLLTRRASVYWWTSDLLFGAIMELYRAQSWSTRHYVWFKPNSPPPMPGCCWSSDELCVHAYPEGRQWNHSPACHPPRSVITANKPPRKDGDHPNEKPLVVLQPFIQASSLPGQLVIDPFAGSGSTLVCARAMGRRAIGIELDERWCELAATRLSQATLPMIEDRKPVDLPKQPALFDAPKECKER